MNPTRETGKEKIAVPPSELDTGVYKRAKARGVNVSEVRVLVWDAGHFPPVATFVFQGDKLWYAKYPAAPGDATLEQLASRYGKVSRTSTQSPASSRRPVHGEGLRLSREGRCIYAGERPANRK